MAPSASFMSHAVAHSKKNHELQCTQLITIIIIMGRIFILSRLQQMAGRDPSHIRGTRMERRRERKIKREHCVRSPNSSYSLSVPMLFFIIN